MPAASASPRNGPRPAPCSEPACTAAGSATSQATPLTPSMSGATRLTATGCARPVRRSASTQRRPISRAAPVDQLVTAMASPLSSFDRGLAGDLEELPGQASTAASCRVSSPSRGHQRVRTRPHRWPRRSWPPVPGPRRLFLSSGQDAEEAPGEEQERFVLARRRTTTGSCRRVTTIRRRRTARSMTSVRRVSSACRPAAPASAASRAGRHSARLDFGSGHHDLLFGGELVVDGRFCDANGVGDHLQRGSADAIRGKKLQSDLHDAGLGGALRGYWPKECSTEARCEASPVLMVRE